MIPSDISLTSRTHKADPYRLYAQLRAESPVHRVSLPGRMSAWIVTRYDDVAALLKDERFIKDRTRAIGSRQPWMPKFVRPLARNMLDLDEPDHGRLRALVNKAFTPRFVEQLRPRIESLADGLLVSVARTPRFDLIRDYAAPIPTTIIAEMLGVPAEDRHRFGRWSNTIVSVNASAVSTVKAIPVMWLFLSYVRRLIVRRRAHPRDDLLSSLIAAEEAGQRMSEDELVAMVFLLLIAGHETTVNLIGNGMLALLEHRDQLERLRGDPSLIKTAVEELLRYDSPVEFSTERWAGVDLTLGGIAISRGELVLGAIASANRDEMVFTNPDQLDLARDPNKHLAFGLGAHYCLGAPLARLEGQIAINALVQRFPKLRLAVQRSDLRWRRSMFLRGLRRLPVALCE